MFRVVVLLNDVGEFPKFTEAFKLFYEKIREAIRSGGVTHQILGTTNFIVFSDVGTELPMDFCDAKDFAYEIGLLVDGKLQEGVEEPGQDVVRAAYSKVARDYLNGETRELLEILNATSRVSSTL